MTALMNDFKYVFQMQFNRYSGFLSFYVVVQIIISLGIVIGFTYLIGESSGNELLYLATGAPTFVLVITGLVLLPQQIASSKTEGYIEFIRTWPVNRGVVMVADTIIWMLIAIPGIVISSLCAHFMFDPGYALSWTIIPAIVLIALASIGVGYGMSYALPPQIAMALTNVLAFGALMFSPINFPMERLPEWLQTLHTILPLYSMAEIMRESLAASTFTADLGNYINLTIWGVIGFGGAILILNKK